MQGTDFLHDCYICEKEIIQDGRRLVGTEYVPYKKETVELLTKLLDFVRKAEWATNDTAKFVARNYKYRRTQLPEVWQALYPDKDRTVSAFKNSARLVNGILCSLFGNNVVAAFMNEDEEKLSEIRRVLTHYKETDIHIEHILGVDAMESLAMLDTTSQQYTVDECKYELYLLARMSKTFATRLFEKCDKDKLAYIYSVISQPPICHGEYNKQRVLMLLEYLLQVERVEEKELPPLEEQKELSEEQNEQPESAEPTEQQTDSPFNSIQQAVFQQYADIDTTDVAFPTIEVIQIIASADTQHLLNKLSKYNEKDVAYTLKQLYKGATDETTAYKTEVADPTLIEGEYFETQEENTETL